MTRFINPLLVNNFVDANILDEVLDGEDAAVNEIVSLVRTGEITLLLPYSVQNEIKNPYTPAHVRRAANHFLFSVEVELTDGERCRYRDLVAAVKGNAEEKNIAPDLYHVWEAAKYGRYFITRDKRLLARSGAIASILQMDVVTPTEFLERVAKARKRATEFGQA